MSVNKTIDLNDKKEDQQTTYESFIYKEKEIKLVISKQIWAYIDISLKKDFQEIARMIFDKHNKEPVFIETALGYQIPKSFQLCNNGIIAFRTTKDENGEPKVERVTISDKWLFVTAKVYSRQHGIHQYEVMAYNPKTKKAKTELCTADNLGKFGPCVSFCMNNLAIITNENCKKELTEYFNSFLLENKDILNEKVTYPHMGWNDELTEFFPYSKKQHFDFTGDSSKYLKNTIDAFSEKGSKKKFIEKMKEFTANKDAEFIMGTSFAAPLLKVLGLRSFALNFFGDSGNFKSLASKFALSAWGDSSKIGSAGNHTKNVLLEKLSKVHNLPLYIDEITEESIDIYGMCNESGRHRLNRVGQILEAVSWRTVMYSTSEISMESDSQKAGETNRLLCIKVNCVPDQLTNKEEYARDLYLFIEKNYGLLGNHFIKKIIEDQDIIRKNYETILNSVSDESVQKQHIYIIAVISLAVYMYRQLFLNIDDLGYAVSLTKHFLRRIAKKKELDPALKMYETIREFYEINKAAFKVNGVHSTNYCYGAVRDNVVIFIINPLKEYLEKKGFNWNEKRVLIERKLIEYKNFRIGSDLGKRLIIDLKNPPDELLEDEYYDFERGGNNED